jgi:hypothetical protein
MKCTIGNISVILELNRQLQGYFIWWHIFCKGITSHSHHLANSVLEHRI